MITKDSLAEFLWTHGSEWLLIVEDESYIWSDPEYGGDGTIRPMNQEDVERFNRAEEGCALRDKGVHRVGNYCGESVKIKTS